MITVIGKLKDTNQFMDLPGFNVMPLTSDWTPDLSRAWLDKAIKRGDKILIVSNEYTGEFKNELICLLQHITRNKR